MQRCRTCAATTTINEDDLKQALKKQYRKRFRRRRDRRQYKYDASLNPDAIADWLLEFRQAAAVENTHARDIYLDAIVVEKDTHLVTEAEVDSLASSMISRNSRQRMYYDFEMVRDLYRIFPGDVVTLQHDRYGLSSGKRGRVISLAENAQNETARVTVLVDE
jgi:hypothetical protein